MQKLLVLPLGVLLFISACKKEPAPTPPLVEVDPFEEMVAPYLTISAAAPDYSVNLKSWFSGMYPSDQPNNAKAQLGRVIFYDKDLSSDGTISCASCHHQDKAFSDPNPVSTGVMGRHGKRNSMALLNTAWFGGSLGIDEKGDALLPLFWDVRAFSVPIQATAAFNSDFEMDIDMEKVVEKMQAKPYYTWLTQKAWGDEAINSERVLESLNHFMLGIGAQNTKFDKALATEGGGPAYLEQPFSTFTAEENRGKELFLVHCQSCHGSLVSATNIFEANNGLESPYIDQGKGALTGNFYEKGIFKVPGLRNIAVSAPYMHDGRFTSLLQVVEHYNSGVKQVFGLHGDLLQFNEATQHYSAQRLHLAEEDKLAIVAFLETLTDENSLKDERFSNPFK